MSSTADSTLTTVLSILLITVPFLLLMYSVFLYILSCYGQKELESENCDDTSTVNNSFGEIDVITRIEANIESLG